MIVVIKLWALQQTLHCRYELPPSPQTILRRRGIPKVWKNWTNELIVSASVWRYYNPEVLVRCHFARCHKNYWPLCSSIICNSNSYPKKAYLLHLFHIMLKANQNLVVATFIELISVLTVIFAALNLNSISSIDYPASRTFVVALFDSLLYSHYYWSSRNSPLRIAGRELYVTTTNNGSVGDYPFAVGRLLIHLLQLSVFLMIKCLSTNLFNSKQSSDFEQRKHPIKERYGYWQQ